MNVFVFVKHGLAMPQDDKALLSRLKAHEVEFVIIGGVCGVMHGVPMVTTDLDICCPFTPSSLRRLEAVRVPGIASSEAT